ncbi:MAG: hypothetical protein JST59_20725 [Actinobacteria bacterium]|nr:hypothetical protein [Actinomycetota bacterium]
MPHLSAVKRTRSDLELLFLCLCDDHGLPRPLANRRVHGHRADFFWPEQRVVVEADSSKRRPGWSRRTSPRASVGRACNNVVNDIGWCRCGEPG